MKTRKKENIIIIAILAVMLIAIIGVSWAAFNFSQAGNTPNKITTGSITMTYTESDNTISLSNALPTTDKTGTTRLKEGEYFDFTVSSEITGDVNINYEISAKEVGEGTIDGSNIKLYLTKLNGESEEQLMSPEVYNEEASSNEYTGRPAGEMSLYTSSMNSSESNDYRLRMYVREEYNPQGDGGGLTFTVKVNVYGKAGDKMPANGPVSDVILENLGDNGSTYDDGYDTFITGEDPNNYVWYSGKLWRAVSVNNDAKTTKLVTQWNISTITYSSGSSSFEGSYMEDWLNDTSVDGFLGNLREPEKFIVMDAVWDVTMDSTSLGSIERPNGTTTVRDAVGLLNIYEYQTSYKRTTSTYGYLNNGLYWWTITPRSALGVVRCVTGLSSTINYSPSSFSVGARPSINLKSGVKIVDGNGSIDNPYRLKGDNDTDLTGTKLNTRYSGEYIKFGNNENNLYRIVSHENGTGTKITSAEPLKSSFAGFITWSFGSNTTFSSENTIGAFLNERYLTNYVDSTYRDMIEESTTWYLGTVGSGASYKLAKETETTTTAKVGLLRMGELMSGQFESDILKGTNSSTFLTTNYWTLTPYSTSGVRFVSDNGFADYSSPSSNSYGVRPSLNLKSNIIITSGDGTKNNPFILELAS